LQFAHEFGIARKAGSPARAAPSLAKEVLRSPGMELDPAVRSFMEPRFGRDFSKVRIHADGRGAESAKALMAQAYTVGNHMAFGSGKYAPHSNEGKKLLAHELAHTVQQSPTDVTRIRSGNLQIGPVGGAAERHADAVADEVAKHKPELAHGVAAPPPSLNALPETCLQRKPDGTEKTPESAQQRLEKTARDAAAHAAQKIEQKLLGRKHIPTAPTPRRVPPGTTKPPPPPHAPPENLRPDPFDVEPVPPPVPDPTPTPEDKPKRDPGEAENQLAIGTAAQTGPPQVGPAVQAAFQDKNIYSGVVHDFLTDFHLQLGVLQPTLTVQLAHLAPISRASPLPPPDQAQFTATFSPAVIKYKDILTLAPQIGVAGSVAGDIFGTTKGPDKSGEHVQALGVVNLQLDYKISEKLSATAAAGYQSGVDSGPHGNKGTEAYTGSLFATFHFK
jgi:Domain of unknown function (DUF4157)